MYTFFLIYIINFFSTYFVAFFILNSVSGEDKEKSEC